jgi:aldose sugar dehydrogenase
LPSVETRRKRPPRSVTRRPPSGRNASDQGCSSPFAKVSARGGLLDLAVSADFASSRRIFLSFVEPGIGAKAGLNGVAVGSATMNAERTGLEGWRVIFRQSPKVNSQGHFGSRLSLRPDGTLFVTLGERQSLRDRVRAQDLTAGHGKVMRIQTDGTAPADNPFVHVPQAQPSIWSFGHRNVQGAALHPQTGELWISEHGPRGGDEINRVLPGRNFGWPLVSHGCEYDAPEGACTPVGGATSGPGIDPPVMHWGPTAIAPSGMTFYTGSRFPEWHGNLFVGALAGQALWRIVLDGSTPVLREALFTGLRERIRDVRQGPDGWLYLLTDSADGRIIRIVR